MKDVQIGMMVVALVGALRTRFPKLDGLLVLLATMLLAVGLTALYAPAPLLPLIQQGVLTGLSAAGIMHLVSYGAGKVGEAMGAATPTLPPMVMNTVGVKPEPESMAKTIAKELQAAKEGGISPKGSSEPPKPPDAA